MQNYDISFNKLIDKIKSTRRKENLLLFINGFLLSLGISISVLFISVVIESIVFGDIAIRTIFAGLIFISFVIGFGIFAFPSLMRIMNLRNNPTINEMALRIGKFYPDMQDNLGNALQLIPLSKNPKGMSSSLALAAFEEYYKNIHQKDFDVVIEKDDFKRNFLIFIIPFLLLIGGTTLFRTSLGDSLNRIINFRQSFLPPIPFSIEITPLKSEIVRDSKFRIEIIIRGTNPSKVWLSTKESIQKEFDSFEIKANSEGKYIYEIPSVKSSMEFFAYSEWYNEKVPSKIGVVKVIEKPIIKSISGRLVFPSYADIAPKYIDERNADITALVGSKAIFELLSNKKIKKANLVFFNKRTELDTNLSKSDTVRYPLTISNNRISGELTIRKTGVYYFELYDEDNYTNDNPINYTIIAQSDNYPEISLIEPSNDIEINSNGLLSIRAKLSDDYGFSYLKLYYRMTESPYAAPDEKYTQINILFNKNELSQEVPYVWDLNKIGIMPDDKYEFYLEVADNDIVSGPKVAKTQIIAVRLPSLREIQKDADVAQEKVQQDLEKIMKEALDLKKDIDELNRETLKDKNIKKEANWQDKKKAEDIAKKQQELKEKLSDVQKKLEETTKNLQENNLLSQETLEKYMELQKLMKQVDSPELRMMQQKMQDALKNMNQDELQKAMENFKFNEEQFRQSIERTTQLLKKIQAEQKIDGLKNRAEQMAKQQDQLSEDTKKSNSNDKESQENLAKKQEKLQNEFKDLDNEFKDLEKFMEQFKEQDQAKDDMKQAKEALNSEQTKSEMKNSHDNIKQGNNNQSQKNQKKASQNLKDFAQKMGQMKQNMKKQSDEETAQKMQKSISDLLELSKRQEIIKNQTQSSDYNSTSLPQFAQNQAQTFESLMNVAKAMSELSKKSFAITPQMGQEMANALQGMRESIEKMADRNTHGAASAQLQAMSSINKTVSQMQEMMDMIKQKNQGSCNNPGGSGSGEGEGEPNNMGSGMSFAQKMQQIAAEQQAVNQAMQKLSQNGQSQGGGKEQLEKQAQQGKLIDKQGAAQKSIEELAKEQKQFGGNNKKLDELEKLSQEMKELMTDMKSKGSTPETMKKQERILSRLLELQKSENERDYEKQRESKTAKDIFAPSPSGLNINNIDNEKVFKDMLRTNQQGYSKDYENLIKSYFDKLKQD